MIVSFLFIYELQDLDIIFLVNFMILMEVFIQDFFDNGFSINHSKSNSSLQIAYVVSKFFIFSLVFEYIIFVIFYHPFFFDFIESQHLVKVNA